jgi:hypothetical protein
MTIRTTTDKAAVVDTQYHWIPLTEKLPPRGSKVLLINQRYGIAVMGPWSPGQYWTHWSPLPTFKENT